MKTKLVFTFTEKALRQFRDLTSDLRLRIGEKLKFWQAEENILSFGKPTPLLKNATHRFRVGNYRVLCKLQKGELIILKVGPRDKVYKGE